jgi:hypothetical protein
MEALEKSLNEFPDKVMESLCNDRYMTLSNLQ